MCLGSSGARAQPPGTIPASLATRRESLARPDDPHMSQWLADSDEWIIVAARWRSNQSVTITLSVADRQIILLAGSRQTSVPLPLGPAALPNSYAIVIAITANAEFFVHFSNFSCIFLLTQFSLLASLDRNRRCIFAGQPEELHDREVLGWLCLKFVTYRRVLALSTR